ncbi:hypothetical protein CY35_07G082400 [Sphagnum magellanicum]|uniref:Uncharacterized protein n=1 Tax=Sphagnum magellanicum TaxID=128215 RepID=A0ACB8HMA9_9BRYO|nr:hypothetical protein CY35_07G082400 [Sphagnum magellanicum]
MEEEEQQEMSFTSPEHNSNKNKSNNRSVGMKVSDCGSSFDRTTWPSLMQRTATSTATRSRTRSLTNENMDELRGCIDLGFGFEATMKRIWSFAIPCLIWSFAMLSPGSTMM